MSFTFTHQNLISDGKLNSYGKFNFQTERYFWLFSFFDFIFFRRPVRARNVIFESLSVANSFVDHFLHVIYGYLTNYFYVDYASFFYFEGPDRV